MDRDSEQTAVSFDFFGTLVELVDPPDPAIAIERELTNRGVSVPPNWEQSYSQVQIETAVGEELSLYDHIRAILSDEATADQVDESVIEGAVRDAFDVEARPRDDAHNVIENLSEHYRVGILSNCSVPGLVPRMMARADIEPNRFDAVVTSVGCGWRKPHPRAFNAMAAALDVSAAQLVHIGDDPVDDGGAADLGATALLIDDTALRDVPALLGDA